MKSIIFASFLILFTLTSRAQEPGYVRGELLVQLNPDSDEMAFFRIFESTENAAIKEVTCLSEIVGIYHVVFTDEQSNLNELIKAFYRYPEVLNAQKNHLVSHRETIPTDTLFNNQWQWRNTGQTGGTNDADIDASDAWDITTGGLTTHDDTIVVCIIEGSGVDLNQPDLQANIWKNHGEIPGNLIDDDNNGYVDDYLGWNVASSTDIINPGTHGTRVAGMVGATGNNVTGVSGVNWNVKMMIVAGQQASNEASVIAAYNYPLVMRKMYNESYGQEGAFVVATNASWGLDNGDPADAPLWCAMYDTLGAYGVLNVAATTNSNTNVDIQGDLPTTCPSEYLIAVTMTNSNDIRANSGYGTTHIDLGAPGSNIYTTSPGGSFYSTVSGTSFASPVVAGCVALAYSAPCAEFINFVKYDPAGAALAMRDYILNGTEYIPALSSDVATGGRMNIANTIDSILANCDPSTCIPPYNLIANNLDDSSVTINWSGFSTDYIVYFQMAGGPINEISVTGATSLQIDTLVPCSGYTVWIAADCGTDTSNLSFPLIFESDGCCKNPSLILDHATTDSLIVSWPAVLYATTYEVRYRPEGEVTWSAILTGVTSPVSIGNLEACTDYEFQIKTTCTDSTQGYSTSQIFRTKGCGACTEQTYCSVGGADTQFEWIEHIGLNGFGNNTGDNNGWYQSDQIITALTPGSTYNFEVAAGYSGFNFTERFSLWIDLNHDGTFDASEMLVNDQSAVGTLVTPITIPVTATIGVTKMRIGMRALTGPDECPSASFYGEYEDYCVYIGPQAGIEESSAELSVYPNPAANMVFVKSDQLIKGVQLYSIDGKAINTNWGFSSQIYIDVSNLSEGIYLLKAETETGFITTKFTIAR